jgi:hypothetical protein
VRRPLVVVGLCVLLLTACDSGGSETEPRTSTTTAPRRPAAGTVAADRLLARAVVVRRTDLRRWDVAPTTGITGAGLRGAASTIPACSTLVALLQDGRVHLPSPKFVRGAATVESVVDVYASAADLQAQLDAYRDPAVIGCLQSLFGALLQSRVPVGGTLGDVSVSPIASPDATGEGYAYRITAPVTGIDPPITITYDVVGIAVGRVGVTLAVAGTDAVDVIRTETTLVSTLTRRIRRAPR